MARDLWHAQTFERSVRGKARDDGIRQQITARERPTFIEARLRFKFQTACACAPEILSLPCDQVRRHAQGDVGDGARDLCPEEWAAPAQTFSERIDERARLAARQTFGAQVLVG